MIGLGAMVDNEEKRSVGVFPGDGAAYYAPLIRDGLTFGHGRHPVKGEAIHLPQPIEIRSPVSQFSPSCP